MRPDTTTSRRQALHNLGRLITAAALPGAGLGLTACSSKPQPQDVLGVPNHATSFTTGPDREPVRAEIFIDPNCGHCERLWNNAKPLADLVKIRWTPISQSLEGRRVAAAIVLSRNPAAVLEEHHRHIAGQLPTPGPLANNALSANRDTVPGTMALIETQANLLIKIGIEGVPLTVRTQAAGMPLAMIAGAVPTAELAAFLGVRYTEPASSAPAAAS